MIGAALHGCRIRRVDGSSKNNKTIPGQCDHNRPAPVSRPKRYLRNIAKNTMVNPRKHTARSCFLDLDNAIAIPSLQNDVDECHAHRDHIQSMTTAKANAALIEATIKPIKNPDSPAAFRSASLVVSPMLAKPSRKAQFMNTVA